MLIVQTITFPCGCDCNCSSWIIKETLECLKWLIWNGKLNCWINFWHAQTKIEMVVISYFDQFDVYWPLPHFLARIISTIPKPTFPSNSKISIKVRTEAPSQRPNKPPILLTSTEKDMTGTSLMTFFSILFGFTMISISFSFSLECGSSCSNLRCRMMYVCLEHSGRHDMLRLEHESSV